MKNKGEWISFLFVILCTVILLLSAKNAEIKLKAQAEDYKETIKQMAIRQAELEEENARLKDERDHFEEEMWAASEEVERLEMEFNQLSLISNDGKPSRGGARGEFIFCKLTAYSPFDNRSGIEGGGITSTGLEPCKKYCAADPKKIPYGTILDVPGYGIVVVEDTGSALRSYGGYQVDLFVDSYDEAVNFGVQFRDVRVIRWGEKGEFNDC